MPFKYHPPTRDFCHVCEELNSQVKKPIIDSENGKASSASNFPIHNWYYFVLGYSPEYPDFILKRERISADHYVVDPFMGSGTTLVSCKMKGIPSAGVDANDYFSDVARVKLNWTLEPNYLRRERDSLFKLIKEKYDEISFIPKNRRQLVLFDESHMEDAENYASHHRPKMLTHRYISDRPYVRAHIIKEFVDKISDIDIREFFRLALSSCILPISNVRYGPGFGVVKPKYDIDVFNIFKEKVNQMITDIEGIPNEVKQTHSDVILGDSRKISKFFSPNSIDLMITSPPYPGDHEYTKHTRLELIFMDYAQNLDEFRKIKKRMIRGSTTNIYKEDNERSHIDHLQSITKITSLIDKRLQEDGATSGFEKLYTKLVWEYFGGMYLVFREAYKVLKQNGKFALLVGDSHAFKMVHIQTAEILSEIAKETGYSNCDITLWQDKYSSSHKYNIKENILTLTK